MTLPLRDWTEMTWQHFGSPDARADVARWIAVLPLAAIEQHGPHLPVGTDLAIGDAYLARALPLIPHDLPVTFLPAQAVGHSTEHLHFPGTLSLSAATAIALLTDLGESVHRAGVRKLLLMTSHGGNVQAMDIVARDLRARLRMLVVTCGWHRFGYPAGIFQHDEIAHGIHGGAIETSLMLAARPQSVAMGRAAAGTPATVAMAHDFRWLSATRPAGFGWMTQDLNPTGAVGDARAAAAAHGEAALDHGARAFVELLQDIDRFDLARLQDGPLQDGPSQAT